MSRKRYEHLHSYTKVKGKVFRCSKPGCPHSLPPYLIIGRKAECPYCQSSFIITDKHIRRVTVHCLQCSYKGKPINKPQLLEEDVDNSTISIFENMLKEKNI